MMETVVNLSWYKPPSSPPLALHYSLTKRMLRFFDRAFFQEKLSMNTKLINNYAATV